VTKRISKGAGAPGASQRLSALAEEYWEGRLRERPVFATVIGDRRYDDRLVDITPEGRARSTARLADLEARLRTIPQGPLRAADRVTRSELANVIRKELEQLRCNLEEWTVDPLEGPQVSLLNIESYQPVRTAEEGRAMVARWRAMGPYLDDHMANLRRGLEADKMPVRACVAKVVEQLEDLAAKPTEEWALLKPAQPPHPDWSEADVAAFHEGLAEAVDDRFRPAILRYLDALKRDFLPQSRPDERPGIMHVPDGTDAYRRLIRVYTGLDLDPDEIHETGLREVARINQETEDLGERVIGTRDRRAILRRLRTDPDLHFATRDEVEAKAREALARARAAIPRFFGRLPKAPCDVVRMGEHEEKHSTIAYYRQPAADGSRPGRYYVNTYAPETRPRYEAEVLAFHESIPGHHLQIAIAQELEDVPAFRRHLGITAFVEGWGLYTERLSDEMGLYTADLDRIGVLSYDAWRACRLVVDTGMHAKGWTRGQAIDFMVENTALAENNIVNEVDRYIAWPGQALAYKVGQLEIRRLRAEAERRLGSRFDLRAFHDAVLGNGAVSLETLRGLIDGYITRAAR
jgi:uncharacterized protein (DUF885 family)